MCGGSPGLLPRLGRVDFYSAYAHGFARVAAVTLPVALADPATNAERTIEQARACHDDGAALAVFPELGLTGYSVDDLFGQDVLLDAVDDALAAIVEASRDLRPLLVVGAPLLGRHRVYNCGVVIHRGVVLGVAPKSHLPTYREFYEARWFAAGGDEVAERTITVAGHEVPFGDDLLFAAADVPGLVVHVEVCEDMWVPVPPSARAALAGATVLTNLSGSPITVARAEDRTCWPAARVRGATPPTSTPPRGRGSRPPTCRGTARRWSTRWAPCSGRASASPTVRAARSWTSTSTACARSACARAPSTTTAAAPAGAEFERIEFVVDPPAGDIGLRRRVARFPFVPDDAARLAQDCYEAYNIQVSGLERRLAAIGQPKVVIGVSGGLDSTHALIVAAKAMDRLGRPRSDIHAFTLPGFATGDTTKSYATRLSTALGCTFAEIDIRPPPRSC